MNQYETVFILTPVLSEDQVKEAVEGYKNFLKSRDAIILYESNWGLKKLAYPIKKKNNGFYNLLEFVSSPQLISELELNFRRDERILRFLTVKLDKHAIAYNKKKHGYSESLEEIKKQIEEKDSEKDKELVVKVKKAKKTKKESAETKKKSEKKKTTKKSSEESTNENVSEEKVITKKKTTTNSKKTKK